MSFNRMLSCAWCPGLRISLEVDGIDGMEFKLHENPPLPKNVQDSDAEKL